MAKRFPKSIHKNQIVRIIWVDSVGQPGWGEYDVDTENAYMETVGFFVKRTAGYTVVAMNSSPFGFGDYMSIPNAAIMDIKEL